MALGEKLEQLPNRPGVYLFKGADGAILYVGKARVLKDRVRSYFQASRPPELHKSRMVEEIADLDLVLDQRRQGAIGNRAPPVDESDSARRRAAQRIRQHQ